LTALQQEKRDDYNLAIMNRFLALEESTELENIQLNDLNSQITKIITEATKEAATKQNGNYTNNRDKLSTQTKDLIRQRNQMLQSATNWAVHQKIRYSELDKR